MGERQMHLQDARLVEVQPLIKERLRGLAAEVEGCAFNAYFDATLRASFIESLRSIGAHEGTVWLLDEARTHLVPKFNNGPNAAEFVENYRLSLREGMISMVVLTEQPICENDVYKSEQQSKELDQRLQLLTCAMLAVPFYFANELRGVLTAVQLKPVGVEVPEPPGFAPHHLEAFQLSASVLARLLEQQLYMSALGLESLA